MTQTKMIPRLAAGLTFVVLCVSISSIILREKRPVILDKPLIEKYINQNMPDARIIYYRVDAEWFEAFSDLTLHINGKGNIAIHKPTLTSFTGGGRVSIDTIGDCVINPGRIFSSKDPQYPQPELNSNSIPDLVSRWDEIYAFLRRNAHDGSHTTRDTVPGCLTNISNPQALEEFVNQK